MTKVYTKSPTGMARLFVWFLGARWRGTIRKAGDAYRFAGQCPIVPNSTRGRKKRDRGTLLDL